MCSNLAEELQYFSRAQNFAICTWNILATLTAIVGNYTIGWQWLSMKGRDGSREDERVKELVVTLKQPSKDRNHHQ